VCAGDGGTEKNISFVRRGPHAWFCLFIVEEDSMTRRKWMAIVGAAVPCLYGLPSSADQSETAVSALDPRNIENGSVILDSGYSDQPYVAITKDGNWLCVLTTGGGLEGDSGQHVVAVISRDKGKTWSTPVDIEPSTGPEASWVMPYVTPSGRVYAFYNYNADNLRSVPNCDSPSVASRVDTLGVYAFKYSDDHGRTWSQQRYSIPMRKMQIDLTNNFGGKALLFWGVGKPITYNQSMIFGFAKVGRWGMAGTLVTSQSVFMRSDNIRTESDPRKLSWELLPDGNEGLRAPKGQIAEEVNLTTLSDGALYCTYRTVDGYNCHAYSHDGGHTWTPREYATYSPGGRRIKHPRAANFVRRFSNGKYVLYYHNHGGEAVLNAKWNPYKGRNPAWALCGVEKSGRIYWSQPEILLYDDDPERGISYPDFVEDNGHYYVTETQKRTARVHEIDHTLLEGAWDQFTNKQVAREGLVLEASGSQLAAASLLDMPRLMPLREGNGFTLEFWVKFRELTAGQVLFDTRDKGTGINLKISERATLELTMGDSRTQFSWDSDPGTHPGTLKVGEWQHIAMVVDSGPRIVSFIVDGQFNDGGAVRDYGWARYPVALNDLNGASVARVAPFIYGELRHLRIYNRYLRTSEVVSNFQAGLP
jgi:hypothetical protein